MKKSFAVTLLFWASLAFGQRDGIPNFSAAEVHDVDTINLYSLVPILNLPIVPKSGGLTVESPQTCYVASNAPGGGTQWACGLNGADTVATFDDIPSEMFGMVPIIANTFVNGNCTHYIVSGFTGLDGLTTYSITNTDIYWPATCGSTTVSPITIDGSGYTITMSTNTSPNVPTVTTVVSRSGSSATYSAPTWTLTDPFSNTFTYTPPSGSSSSSMTDYLGAVTTLGKTNNTNTPESYSYKDTTGTTQNVTYTYGSSVAFKPLGNSSCVTGTTTNVTPISSIKYPDSTSVSLTWATNSTGISGLVGAFTMRTGGTVTYTYGSVVNPSSCGLLAFASLSRATSDGTTNYTASSNVTTVLDPGKNKTVYTFLNSSFKSSIANYKNTGTVASPTYTEISSMSYCYNNHISDCSTYVPSYPITQLDTYQYTYKPDGTQVAMSHDVQTYDSMYGLLLTDANTDSINSQTITTTYVYGTFSSGTCSAITNTAVVDHPCTVTTKNGSTWLSESTYTYNANGALTSSAVCLTSTCTGSSALTTNYTRNSTGTPATVTLPNSQVITNTFGSCNSLLLTDSTTTVNSVAIDNKTTWDSSCNGLAVDTTDPNSNEDDTTYDSMNRVSTHTDRLENVTSYAYGTPTLDHVKVTDPLNVVSYQYNDGLGRPTNSQVCQTTGCSNLDTSSKSYAWNGTNFETKTYVPCVQTVLNTACTTVELTSDVNPIAGPTLSTDANSGTLTYAVNSKDFSVTAGPAPSVDGENTKVLQTEIDGFGRTTSTCALTSSGYNGRVPCGQTMGNNGTLTSNAYSFDATTGAPKVVTTRGSQTHTTITDSIGRPTSIATAEAGTATATYDTVAGNYCTRSTAYTSNGDLVATADAAGNHICFYYDGLHRVGDVGNNNQSATNNCKTFRYDSTANNLFTAPSGYPSSGNNLVGRLMEAATDNCTTPITAITDVWFAYDKMGRITDEWELSPNSSSTYRHTTVAYDADGTVTSLSGIPTISTLTYAVDGEDRWNTATLGASTTIVSGVTYDAASRPTEIDFGTGTDKDKYSWDNVGNMTQYQFFVGSANNKGVLTWNSIGSLQSLAITDGFNSNNTQTCNFGKSGVMGYDDVGRILDDDCGTVWAQTYSYDQYDNLTKAGSLAWNPGYISTNNEYNNGATYDSNGNLTKDSSGMGANTYTYNVYNRMASENSTTATYDAFGNMVAFGSYEYLYSPMGKLGVLLSGAVYTSTIPLPGGMSKLDARASNSNYAYHYDWLGSSRTASSINNSTVNWSKSLSPYGDPYGTGSNINARFAGMEADTFTGITYSTPNRELAYNASRWLSPDPAHAGWNAYAYPTDPNTQTDPDGLEPQTNQTVPNGLSFCGGGKTVAPDGTCIETVQPINGNGATQVPPIDCYNCTLGSGTSSVSLTSFNDTVKSNVILQHELDGSGPFGRLREPSPFKSTAPASRNIQASMGGIGGINMYTPGPVGIPGESVEVVNIGRVGHARFPYLTPGSTPTIGAWQYTVKTTLTNACINGVPTCPMGDKPYTFIHTFPYSNEMDSMIAEGQAENKIIDLLEGKASPWVFRRGYRMVKGVPICFEVGLVTPTYNDPLSIPDCQ